MSLYLDAIAAMGSGSLHPGGFAHTLSILRNLSISDSDVVLDIGCGTGRTACHLAKTYGAHVFAMDNSPTMIAKAKARAAQEGAEVHFVLGDALNMPFADGVADLIFIESVLVFLPVRKFLAECFRVLKKNGILVDVELLAGESLSADSGEQLQSICGLSQLPTLKEWVEYFRLAGLKQEVVKSKAFPGPLENLKEVFYIDPHREVSHELKENIELQKVLRQYQRFILKNRRNLGFGTFVFRKPELRNHVTSIVYRTNTKTGKVCLTQI